MGAGDTLTLRIEIQDDGTAVIRDLKGDIRDFADDTKKSSAKSEGAFQKFTTSVRGGLSEIRKGLNDTFNIGLGIMVADALQSAAQSFEQFITDSVTSYLEVEDVLTNVRKTTGLSVEETQKLGKTFQQMAIDLKALGEGGTTELGEIAVIAGRLGIASEKIDAGKFAEAREELAGFAEVMAMGKISLDEFTGGAEEIADVIAKQIALYRSSSDSAETYLSVMNKLGDNSASDARKIASFIESFTMGPQLGIFQHEAAAIGATFISLGQNANDSATRFQSGIQQILVGSEKTNEAVQDLFEGNSAMAAELESLVGHAAETIIKEGIETKNYVALLREAIGEDAVSSIQVLIDTLGQMDSRSERVTTTVEIFGRIGSRVMSALIGDYGELTEAGAEVAQSLLNSEDALQALEQATDTTRNTFQSTGEFIAHALQEKPEAAIDILIEKIRGIEDPVQRTQIAISAFGEEAGQLIAEGGKTGLELLQKHLTMAEQETTATVSSIREEYQRAIQKHGTAFKEFETQVEVLQEQIGAQLVPLLAEFVKTDLTPMIEQFRIWLDTSEEARHFFAETLPGALKLTAAAIKGIAEAGVAAYDFLVKGGDAIGTLIGDLQTGQTTLNDLVMAVGESFGVTEEQAGIASETIKGSLEDIQGYWEALPETIEALSHPWETLKLAGGEAWEVLKDAGESAMKAIETKVANTKTAIIAPFREAKDEVVQTYQDLAERVTTFFTDVKALPADLAAEFEAGMERITGTVTQTFDDAKAAVTRFGEAMNASVFQNEQAIGFFQKLTDKIYGVETALEKKSLTPALRRYIQAALESGDATGQLTDEMRQSMESVLEADRAFQQNKRSIVEQQNEVRRLSIQIREQENALRTASKAEQAGIQATLVELRNKKAERQNQIDLLRIEQEAVEATLELDTETVRTYQDECDALAALNKEREASLQTLKDASYSYQQEQQQIARANEALHAYYSSTSKATDDVRGTQQATEDYIYTLDELNATLAESQQISISFGATIENLGDDLATISRNFDIAGLGDIGSGIGQLPDLFTDLKGSLSGIPDSLGNMKAGLSGLAGGDILGGLSGLVGGIGGITSAMSALSSAWSIGKSIWGGIKDLFGDSKSEGNKAAAAMRDFVDTNIEGGAELSAAMGEMYGEMKAAGFDYTTFLQQTGTTFDQVFGGISGNWEHGTTAMDLFTQAIGRATGNMEKAPQVSLQMMAAFQEMGLSAEEAGAKMLEIAEASGLSEAQVQALQQALGGVQEQLLGAGEEGEVATTMFDAATGKAAELTGTTDTLSGNLSTLTEQLTGTGAETLATTNIFQLARGSAADLDTQTRQLSGDVFGLAGQISGAGTQTGITSGLFGEAGQKALGLKGDMAELGGELDANTAYSEEFRKSLEDIPRTIDIQVNFLEWSGNAPPGMAEGGMTSGLALVGDKYGPEIARLPSGRSVFVGLEGPEILPFPGGTEIIPNRKIREYVRTHRVSAMAEGGIVAATEQATDQRQPPTQTIIEEHYHLNLYTRVIDRGTIKLIDEGLRQLKKNRSGNT